MTAAPSDTFGFGLGSMFENFSRLASMVVRLLRPRVAKGQALEEEIDGWLESAAESEETLRRLIGEVTSIRDEFEPTRDCFGRLPDMEMIASKLDALAEDCRALRDAAEINLSMLRTVRGHAHANVELLALLDRLERGITPLRRGGEDLVALVEEAHDRVMVVLAHRESGDPVEAEVAFRELGWDA